MKSTVVCRRVCAAASIGVLLLAGATSCRHRSSNATAEEPAVVAPELHTNNVAALPGLVYQSQAKSPIRWQPWAVESFERAKAAKRMVLLVIAMPQHTTFHKVLSDMAGDAGLVAQINDNYVPVLVDADATRELGLLAADLADEIKVPVQLPMFVWLTPNANPVAWIPAMAAAPESVRDLFDKSHAWLMRSWTGDSEYVKKNSLIDNQARRVRIGSRRNEDQASKKPAVDVLKAIRQLTTLYDPVSRSFDEAGGQFPSGTLDLLASVAITPSVPKEMRARSLKMLQELLKDVLPSPMFDPLDGGLFAMRRASTWEFPVFDREGSCQARAIVALLRAYQATRDPLVLERALGVLAYAEKTFSTRSGGFALGDSPGERPKCWLWTTEDIRKALPEEDATWWIAASGMHGLGNLPFEADPTREFFRYNTLAWAKPMAQIAAGLGLSPEAFKPRFETARKILLKTRDERLGGGVRDETEHAATTLRMVSAYAVAYGVTGNPQFRDKAIALLEHARKTFSDGPQLWMYAAKSPPAIAAGRAFLYGLAMQATLDVADITGEEKHLVWADDLATTSAERFTATDFLKECPDNAKIIDLPITDLTMLFDESTAGLISMAEGRLAARGRPLVESFSRVAIPLPMVALGQPVMHTDLLQATLVRHYAPLVINGKDLSPAMQTALSRLPLRMVKRRAATAADSVASGSVKIVLADQTSVVVATPEALQDALLPTSANQ
ncbi:MAG: DUF255 domain-containing protein [Verrucomicrobiota bacterium]